MSIDPSRIPRTGLRQELYVHVHHALRALRGAAERHPEDEGIAAARERLGVVRTALLILPSESTPDAL